MTIGDANDINHVLDYMLGTRDGERLTAEKVRESAARLADHARKALSAGLDGDDVRKRWRGYERKRSEGYRRVVRALRTRSAKS
jgi:hypothetical protein